MKEHRVVGPPGTGKTTYLQRQFERAALQFGVENVYACSLTRTASAEIASRVERVPKQNIGTLHSHAYRLLKYPQIVESAKGLKEWNEHVAGRWRVGMEHVTNPEYATPEPVMAGTDGGKLLQEIGVLRQRMIPPELWKGSIKAFYAEWCKFKLEKNYLDFTDLIEGALSSVDQIPGCRVLFVDEAQDMSKLEFALARKWGRKCDQLVIVGDPDQNLYEWRGSDPDAFYASEATSEHILSQSYRVPREPHRAARQWIKQIDSRKDAAYEPVDHSGSVAVEDWTWKDPTPLINEIESLTDGKVMVLASCGYMLNPLVAGLRRRGLPFHNPYRTNHGGWNPLSGTKRLLAFLRPSRQVWGDDSRVWTWNDVRLWSEVLVAKETFQRGFKSAVDLRCTEDRFRDSQADEEVDFKWLMEMCANDEVRHAVFDTNIDWWESRLRHNDLKSQQFGLSVARRHGASRLLEPPRIVVGTIHSVKGGEADHVYLFPDLSPVGYWDGWKHQYGRDAVVRQFYVGMTRTKERLVLCRPSSKLAVAWQ